MIGLFKQKSPGNVVILILFGLLLKMPLFLYPKTIVTTDNDGRLYQWLISSLPASANNNAILSSLLSFFLLYVQALMLNYLLNEYKLMPKPNFLPAMAYLMVTSLLPDWNYLSAPLMTNTFIIWLFIRLLNLYNTGNAKAQVYNIGLIAGISSYIYFPSVLFVLCILLGIMILKSFRFNEMVLFIIGCLTPYYFHAIYLFLVSKLSIANFFPHISITVPSIKNSIWLAASTLLLTLPFLMGGYYIQIHLRKMLIQVRKNWSIILLYLVMAFFVPFINSNQLFHTWILIVPPFVAFHSSAYYYPVKRLLPLFLFFITVGFIIYQQYWTPTWH